MRSCQPPSATVLEYYTCVHTCPYAPEPECSRVAISSEPVQPVVVWGDRGEMTGGVGGGAGGVSSWAQGWHQGLNKDRFKGQRMVCCRQPSLLHSWVPHVSVTAVHAEQFSSLDWWVEQWRIREETTSFCPRDYCCDEELYNFTLDIHQNTPS